MKKAEFEKDVLSINNDGIVVDQNNNDAYDKKPAEKTIFIDRIVKLALEDKIFTEQNVMDELKTILLAVRFVLIYKIITLHIVLIHKV